MSTLTATALALAALIAATAALAHSLSEGRGRRPMPDTGDTGQLGPRRQRVASSTRARRAA